MQNRWWIYQKERFPVLKHGLLIAVFSTAAVGYSVLLSDGRSRLSSPSLGAMLIAFITLFLCFLQLRIADEFKDYSEDVQYRPYRPVPRGLVSLRELALVAIASACIQLGLACSMGLPSVLLLTLVWGYMALMRQEFFVPTWLKARPLLYMLSHAVILPLMAMYAAACDWLASGTSAPQGLIRFLLVSFFTSLAIELGRKIRAPQDEEPGVATYSALWGQRRAAIAWLSAVWLMGMSALWAAIPIQSTGLVTCVFLLLISGSGVVVWRFARQPTSARAKGFEAMTGLWTLLIYLSLGIVPWVV
ncbi:MAG: UbiA family prenyltransferase [Leptolyngbyaceae cyanobacterium CRU_2_3]|nr:UbiA family prenyltransferase [Leptolyngbyaceae cyanobacterium CRU_2_3]